MRQLNCGGDWFFYDSKHECGRLHCVKEEEEKWGLKGWVANASCGITLELSWF
jgi:hypothetical protein